MCSFNFKKELLCCHLSIMCCVLVSLSELYKVLGFELTLKVKDIPYHRMLSRRCQMKGVASVSFLACVCCCVQPLEVNIFGGVLSLVKECGGVGVEAGVADLKREDD